jgi:hypothetical protein
MSSNILSLTNTASSIGIYSKGTTFCGKQNGSSFSSFINITDARINDNGVMIAQIASAVGNDNYIYVIKCVCSAGSATVRLSGIPATPASLIIDYIYMPLIIQI